MLGKEQAGAAIGICCLHKRPMAQINQFLQKAFVSSLSSIVLPLGAIAYALAKCAKANTYVETLDRHADSLHAWIGNSYDVDFKQAFQLQVLKALKRLGVGSAKLAVDYTSEPFYGGYRNLYLFDVVDEKWGAEFRFAVVSLILQHKTMPLMAIPVRLGDGMAKPSIELLEFCQTILPSIRYVLFDRGFYCAELIDYLEAKSLKYCMLVPEKKGKIRGYVTQTETFEKFPHPMKYSKAKSSWKPQTTIVVCKGVDKWTWIFATNICLKGRCEYILLYKKRWRIETGFRVQDEARIKSKSCSIMVRYFYFLVSCLFQLTWVVHKHVHDYMPFKRYLDTIEQLLFIDFLGLREAD